MSDERREIHGLTQAVDRQGCWLALAFLLIIVNTLAVLHLASRIDRVESPTDSPTQKAQP